MKKRGLLDPVVSTHLLFMMNSILYAMSEFFVLSVVLLLCTICSFYYHLSNETDLMWKRLDHIMCIVSLGCIFSYLIVFVTINDVLICLGWLGLSLVIYKTGKINYQIFHTIWHVAVFVGNVLVWYVLTNS